ncbi:hypothetical protein G195_001491 [Phytophthora kernoviae 00238/432]|uniref:Alginate lyase domain-containing protein n=1 Tax=Phytophthora kernoviae 00238/432 TaxID=1284355 RepID=A0A8J4STQ2_9STRA|nr:hypothetical protein G195_001491 [Phytophthora kernoviae 00238/432]
MLVRTIGNALPPRHDPTRAFQNLRFILQHEDLQDDEVGTHWVLNRLADSDVAQQFRDLLTEFGAAFTELPLELDVHAKAPFHVVLEDEGVDRVHHKNRKQDQWTKVQNTNAFYGSKNRYALGINVARNAMLDIARESGAKWLLPWDQACFVTREAWHQIKRDLDAAAPGHKYFVSFMDRLAEENDVIFSPGYKAHPWEEPQIIFRNDAVERFDEQLRYGQRDKAALLVRLQVPGPWDDWGWSTWERRRTYANMSKDVSGENKVPSTGYVLRLYSGLASGIEENTRAASFWREMRRAKGVVAELDKLEERVMVELLNYRPDKLLIYNEALLRQYSDQIHTELVSVLLADADRALHVLKPWTVMINGALDPERDPRIFANFYDHHEGDGILDDGEMFRNMAYNTTTLVLAWRLTNNTQYALQAASFLDTWCANPTSAMRATLQYADMSYQKLLTSKTGVTRGSAMGIRHTAVMPMLLDAIRLLNASWSSDSRAWVLPDELSGKITLWARALFDDLRSEYALDTFRSSSGLFGLLYDVQVAALAAFLDDPKTLRYTLGTMQGRLVAMLTHEEKLLIPTGVATKAYTLLTLAAWGAAVNFAQQFGLAEHLFQFDLTRTHREERVDVNGGLLCRFIGHSTTSFYYELAMRLLNVVLVAVVALIVIAGIVQAKTPDAALSAIDTGVNNDHRLLRIHKSTTHVDSVAAEERGLASLKAKLFKFQLKIAMPSIKKSLEEVVKSLLNCPRLVCDAGQHRSVSNFLPSDQVEKSEKSEKSEKMFSTWDIVRPRLWHPMSMLELSMMDTETMPQLSMSMRNVPGVNSDEEFFKDLPTTERQKETKAKEPETGNEQAFSSYSFSSSSVVDEEGRMVMSTRRRYEDSSGRLKAEHERELLGKRMKTVWNRKNTKDEGEHHTICSQGTADDFEKLWSQTAFGKAQQKKSKELKESGDEASKTSSSEKHQAVKQSETAPTSKAA